MSSNTTTVNTTTPIPVLPSRSSGIAISTPWIVAAITGYLLLVQLLRFRREKSMRIRYGFPDRESLKKMTVEQAQQIIRELLTLEFPSFVVTSLQFGMFKTYGIESISKLLLETGNLTDSVASLKRYEDTAIIIGEFMSNPPNSLRATTSIARMNWLHSKYITSGKISNEDMLYTLSVFITEPERFARLYEWRSFNEMEYCAYGLFWMTIGQAMNIDYSQELGTVEWKDGLDFAQSIARWAKTYEVKKFIPSRVNEKPAHALIPMITYWVPSWGQEFAKEGVTVLLGDRVREAFMLPEPGVVASSLVYTGLLLRKLALRHLFLPRFVPFERHIRITTTDSTDQPLHINYSYGNYPFYIKPTLWNRWGPEAWVLWLAGGKLPGEEPQEHFANGFRFEDLGPLKRMGQGTEDIQRDIKRMRGNLGGCPFG